MTEPNPLEQLREKLDAQAAELAEAKRDLAAERLNRAFGEAFDAKNIQPDFRRDALALVLPTLTDVKADEQGNITATVGEDLIDATPEEIVGAFMERRPWYNAVTAVGPNQSTPVAQPKPAPEPERSLQDMTDEEVYAAAGPWPEPPPPAPPKRMTAAEIQNASKEELFAAAGDGPPLPKWGSV